MDAAAPAGAAGRALARAYEVVADSLLHPRDRRLDGRDRDRALGELPPPVAEPMEAFFGAPASTSARHYVDVLELAPPCPLYLGAHLFDEPETCREAGTSERNPYLVALRNLYRHFGLEASGRELPDYLPLMVEFLGLTVDATEERDASVRRYFVEKLLLPGLDPLEGSLREAGSPYALPVRALRAGVGADLDRMPDVAPWRPPPGEAGAPKVACGRRLDDAVAPAGEEAR